MNDEAVPLTANRGSQLTQVSVSHARGWLTSSLLAFSLATNIWLILEYQASQREQRLQQYNLDWFRTHEFADLRSQVAVNEKLITVFQCRR